MSRCFLSAAIVLGIASSGLTASGANLLNNPGFEDPLGFDFSDTSNWNGFFGGPAGVTLEAFNDTGAPANSGAQALELTIEGDAGVTNGANSFVGHVQQVLGISAGDDLTYSVFARNNGSGLTGETEFRLEFFDASDVEVSRTQILISGLTDEYQPFSFSETAPVGAVRVAAVMASATFNDQNVLHSHSVLFDDVSLTVAGVIPEPTSALLVGVGLLGFGPLGRRRR